MRPSPSVLAAFCLESEPERLDGGQGTAYRCGQAILKPVDDSIESAWIADLFDNLSGHGFEVPRPIRTKDSAWLADGWAAWQRFEGHHLGGRWDEKLRACRAFHWALAPVPCPDFFDRRTDPWSIADRMAWGDEPIQCLAGTRIWIDRLARIFGKEKPWPNQLVHGDICGNFLFPVEGPPCVIDFSPYWRPADFAAAVMVVDATTWEGADLAVIDSCRVSPELLARAALRRILEHDLHFRMRAFGDPADADRYGPVVERIECLTRAG